MVTLDSLHGNRGFVEGDWLFWLRSAGRNDDTMDVFEVECIIQVSVKKRQAMTPIKDVKQNLKKLLFFSFFKFQSALMIIISAAQALSDQHF